MNYPKIIGLYFIGLGWISLGDFIYGLFAAFWTHQWNFDITFVMWFWLGSCLARKSKTARSWAIFISGTTAVLLILALFIGDGVAHVGSIEVKRPDAGYFAVLGFLAVVLAIPGLLLLLPGIRRQFETEPNQSPEPTSTAVTPPAVAGDRASGTRGSS